MNSLTHSFTFTSASALILRVLFSLRGSLSYHSIAVLVSLIFADGRCRLHLCLSFLSERHFSSLHCCVALLSIALTLVVIPKGLAISLSSCHCYIQHHSSVLAAFRQSAQLLSLCLFVFLSYRIVSFAIATRRSSLLVLLSFSIHILSFRSLTLYARSLCVFPSILFSLACSPVRHQIYTLCSLYVYRTIIIIIIILIIIIMTL